MESSSEELAASRKRQHSSPCSTNSEHDLKRKKVHIEENTPNYEACNASLQEEKASETEQLHISNNESQKRKLTIREDEPEDSLVNKLEEKLDTNECDLESGSTEIEQSSAVPNEENVEVNCVNSPKNIVKTGENSEVPAGELDKSEEDGTNSPKQSEKENLEESVLTDSDEEVLKSSESNTPNKKTNVSSKKLTPKQLMKKLENEKRRQEKQKEREERMKKKLEEQLKRKEEKDKELEQKQKEKELKRKELEKERELKRKEKEEREEKKRKEKEEKEQKRKEKEEKEEQKRKEREEEKLKKLQEIEEKNKEKLKEEEKKQKAAAAFVNFFVPKKTDEVQDSKKTQTSNFLEFEVKSDMKLPLPRRDYLSEEQKNRLESYLEDQDEEASYLKDLSSGKPIGKSLRTWPCEESSEDDVVVVDLGETICEEKSQKYKAKFLSFHENRRPAYYGTWRKKSTMIKPRKPLAEDSKIFNYEEDSDDDWEEEEQGESLDASDGEADKENEDEKDDYEVDNDFFVPHGHLSDDEVDDEENARLSPESLKQKLKLLKEEFDQDMQSKTHKLKPRSIGCIWYNKDSSNVEEAVDRYLQPLAIISRGQIIIKKRDEIFIVKDKKKVSKDLDSELVPLFLKMVHGSSHKKRALVDRFLSDMENAGNVTYVSKGMLIRAIKKYANWEKYKDKEAKRFKFRWYVHKDLREKYNLAL